MHWKDLRTIKLSNYTILMYLIGKLNLLWKGDGL